MIKRFDNYIKEHNEIDPYGEENWNEDINNRKEEIIKYFDCLFGKDLTLTKVARWKDLKEYCEHNGVSYQFVILTIKDHLNNSFQ